MGTKQYLEITCDNPACTTSIELEDKNQSHVPGWTFIAVTLPTEIKTDIAMTFADSLPASVQSQMVDYMSRIGQYVQPLLVHAYLCPDCKDISYNEVVKHLGERIINNEEDDSTDDNLVQMQLPQMPPNPRF